MDDVGQSFDRSLLECAPVAIYHTDARGRFTYVNAEYRRIFDLAPDQDPNDWVHSVHPEDRERMRAAWVDFCRNGTDATFEYRTQSKAGQVSYFAERVVAARTAAGFVGTISDLSDLITARLDLTKAERLHRDTFDQAPVGIAYADRDGRLLRCNQSFGAMLGLSPAQLIGRSIDDLTYADDLAAARVELQRLWSGEVDSIDQEKRYKCAHGVALWVRATTALVADRSGRPTCSVEYLRDIALRKELSCQLRGQQIQLEEMVAELRASSDKYRMLIENTSAIPWEMDGRTGTTVYIAPLGRALFDVDADNGGKIDLVEHMHGDDREEFRRFIRTAAAAAGCVQQRLDSRIVTADGTVKHIRSYIAARGPNTPAGSVCGVSVDITEQRRLESDLAQAQKLESIGQLSAGIAHEINTPTQFIGNNVEFLRKGVEGLFELLDRVDTIAASGGLQHVPVQDLLTLLRTDEVSYLREEVPRAIAETLEGIERIQRIVGAMKEFSHPAVDRTAVDLNHAINSTVIVASNEWKYVAELEMHLDPDLPAVPVMPGMFNQVILNMIVNAAHAIDALPQSDRGHKGLITISTRLCGGWAEVCIADTGSGIPEAIRGRIFDPFFTTKPVGKGTGQGLAIAHDVIVNKHGGSIRVESEVGRGTTFTLRLPLLLEHAVAA